MSIFHQKRFNPTPPDKGSFPLDHENACKLTMLRYMTCLKNHRDDTAQCREETKNYLQCRMDNNLMAKEEWSYLGFKDQATDVKVSTPSDK